MSNTRIITPTQNATQQAAFEVTLSAPVSITQAGTTILWDVVNVDNQNSYNPLTGTYIIPVGFAGHWLFTAAYHSDITEDTIFTCTIFNGGFSAGSAGANRTSNYDPQFDPHIDGVYVQSSKLMSEGTPVAVAGFVGNPSSTPIDTVLDPKFNYFHGIFLGA